MHLGTISLAVTLALAGCARPGAAVAPETPALPAVSPPFASSDSSARDASTAPAIVATVTGHGPPMILIPGLACSGQVWNGMVARYSDRYEIHVFTLAGFAGTPPATGNGNWLAETSQEVEKYVAGHKLVKPIVVGHSLGGVLAYQIAEESPGLFGPIVAVDAVPFLPALRDGGATPASVRPIAERLRDGIVKASPDAARERNRRALAGMITDPTNVERVAMWEDASDPATIGRAMFDVMTTDLRPQVGKIRSPLLLIAAGNLGPKGPTADDVERAYAEQVDAVPDHAIVVAPKARHFVMLDDPSFFYAKVDAFLSAKTGAR